MKSIYRIPERDFNQLCESLKSLWKAEMLDPESDYEKFDFTKNDLLSAIGLALPSEDDRREFGEDDPFCLGEFYAGHLKLYEFCKTIPDRIYSFWNISGETWICEKELTIEDFRAKPEAEPEIERGFTERDLE